MIIWLRRTLTFARFTLREYVRSGRIMIEALLTVVVVWVLFWPRGSKGMDPSQFFNLAGLFLLSLAAYTTLAMMRLGKRPQGYVLLARPLGRSGYLSGLYLASITISISVYLFLSATVPLLNWSMRQPLNLSWGGWLLGTLPLFLDVVIVSSFLTLLTPLVMPLGPRLALLALLVITLSTDLELADAFRIGDLLQPVQALLGLLLAPVLSGFMLAVERQYSEAAIGILLGQLALAVTLHVVALLAFKRRELILLS